MATNRPELWVARHGETEWSLSGQHTGRTDIPLTPGGEKGAKALGELLGGKRFELVLSSPLQRARRTCELAGYGEKVEITEDLLEWNYGEHEGRTTPQIREDYPGWTIWEGEVPGGETPEQVAARAQRVIDRVLQLPGSAILFAHGHVLRVLTATWLGLPPQQGRLSPLGPAGYGVLGWEHEWRVVSRWNVMP